MTAAASKAICAEHSGFEARIADLEGNDERQNGKLDRLLVDVAEVKTAVKGWRSSLWAQALFVGVSLLVAAFVNVTLGG
jgi:hypothetical protein